MPAPWKSEGATDEPELLRLVFSATAIQFPRFLKARIKLLVGKRADQRDHPLHEHLPVFFCEPLGEKRDDVASIREFAFPPHLPGGFKNTLDELMRGFRNTVSLQLLAPQERTHGFDELEGRFWRWRLHGIQTAVGLSAEIPSRRLFNREPHAMLFAMTCRHPRLRAGERGVSESAVHQTSEVIVRQLLWRVSREKFLQLDPQDFHQIIEFKIQNELQARLDFGNPAPRNVPPSALQFCREL